MFLKIFYFVKFLIWPLLRGFRFIWLILAFIFAYPGYMVLALDIPKKEQLKLIDGFYIDSTKEYSRNGQHSTRIRTDNGDIYTCICSAGGGNPNCLSKDAIVNKNLSNNLSGRRISILMYPSSSVYGDGNLCYQVADKNNVYLSYEESVELYGGERAGWNVCAFILFCFSMIVYVFVRVYQFKGLK